MEKACYHCNLPILGAEYSAVILQQQRYFCCPGCQAVAEAIQDNGLENYYRFRSEAANKPPSKTDNSVEPSSLFDNSEFLAEFVEQSTNGSEIQLSIAGINCAACGWLIEKQLSKLQGINKVGANVTTKRLYLNWQQDQITLSQVLAEIKKIGYEAQPFQSNQHEALHHRENKALLKRLGLAGLMTMQVMMLNLGLLFDWFGHIDEQTQHYFSWVSLILSTPVALYSAAGFYRSALIALKSRAVNMDVPISVALLSIYFSSSYATLTASGQTYFESLTMFVFLLLISRYLEQNSRFKASQISSNLLSYMPTMAIQLVDGEHKSILAKRLILGQQVLVKAGDVVPIDGEVVEGQGQIDESMLTGEFELVAKAVGDNVYAGTINQVGTLVIEVKQLLSSSLVNQINQLQNKALLNKPRLANFADRFAQYFVMAVLLIAATAYACWHFIDPQNAFWIAISVLIATCPCALGLATPVSLTCAIGNLNRRGILIKRADVIEQIPNLDWLGLDKTGTLTQGKFTISKKLNLSDLSDSEVLELAASLEQYSSHPISLPFKQYLPRFTVQDVKEVISQGISGYIEQQEYRIGSAHFMQTNIIPTLNCYNVYLSKGSSLIAAFELTDELRPNAQELLAKLNFKHVEVMSGDSEDAVKQIAQTLKINHWQAQLSPQDKLALIKQAQQQGYQVLMVGDGINDAPVLAQANVSITLGIGTDLAKSSADIILLDNNLDKIPHIFTLAKHTNNIIKQNIAWAIGYNMLVLPLAVFGLLSPLAAVVGMSLSSLIVVINSTRLLTK